MPLQIPKRYEARFAFIADPFRRVAHAMGSYLDEQVGALVGALEKRGMWASTLFVFHADNGGEIMGAGICGGNNWPLTGGKFSNWEGGIRVNALVNGGLIPSTRRGTVESSLTAVWDWYATYAHLAGQDPTDHAAAAAGLPPVDSVNLWPLLSSPSHASSEGPVPVPSVPHPSSVRLAGRELSIGETSALTPNGDGHTLVGGLLQANGSTQLWKLLLGAPDRQHTIDQYVRTGPEWPNATSRLIPLSHFKVCGREVSSGCLFELHSDPYERRNLASVRPSRFRAMLARVDALQATVYSPVRGAMASPRACKVAGENGGYWGPFLPSVS